MKRISKYCNVIEVRGYEVPVARPQITKHLWYGSSGIYVSEVDDMLEAKAEEAISSDETFIRAQFEAGDAYHLARDLKIYKEALRLVQQNGWYTIVLCIGSDSGGILQNLSNAIFDIPNWQRAVNRRDALQYELEQAAHWSEEQQCDWSRTANVLFSERYLFNHPFIILDESDLQSIIDQLEEIKTDFIKRIHTYLKRFGLSKVTSETYWLD